MSTHPQSFACRIRATGCRTFKKDAAPLTCRPWAGGIRTCATPQVVCLPNMRQPLPHFSNRCRSSLRPAVTIKRSTRPLHPHQSASARGSRHRTSWAAGIRAGTSPRVHGLPPAADGGGGRARERGAGLGGARLAAGPPAGRGRASARDVGRRARARALTHSQAFDPLDLPIHPARESQQLPRLSFNAPE
eukprot:COSAG02_NODE_6835_length_3337_cov_4.737492_3_plen_190_part_00